MTHQEQTENQKYRNWVKGRLSLKYLKNGMEQFANKVVLIEHHNILKRLGIEPTNVCKQCKLETLHEIPYERRYVSIRRQCPNNSCEAIYQEILNTHTSTPLAPCWKNSDITKWITHPWEIAKCFINASGYADKADAEEIDVAGLLHIFINSMWFQNHFTVKRDLFSKMLQTRNSIFHSSSLELDEKEICSIINDTIAILEDDKELKNYDTAKEAVVKVRQLQDQHFIISTDDEREVCKEALLLVDEQIKERKRLAKETKDDIASMDDLKVLRDTLFVLEDRFEELEVEHGMQQKNCEDGVTPDLRKDLINYYIKNESTISVSPLFDAHDVSLIKLYVRPPMAAFNSHHPFGYSSKQDNPSNEKTLITSYRQLLINDKKVPFSDIYVTAEAGIGKSSFSQHLTMTWCLAHLPAISLERKVNKIFEDDNVVIEEDDLSFTDDDIDCLKQFDLCFLLHLRDFQGSVLCSLDDMIWEFLSENMSQTYSRDLFNQALHEKRCLVILDGLDELCSGNKFRKRKGNVPHRKTRQYWTVLTTTRPWRLSTAELPLKQIDRHVEICQLDTSSSKRLLNNAVQLLNCRSGIKKKHISDFENKISSVKLKDLCSIPYVKMQLVCVWFDDKDIGNSKCEVYSNVIELTLKRGLKKISSDLWQHTQNFDQDISLPKCLSTNKFCNDHKHLLCKLGRLAFLSLFHEVNESTLIIERESVLKYLNDSELDNLLTIGLLSQCKDQHLISEVRQKVFFPHKSIHEFFAGLHVSMKWQDEETKQILFRECKSLTDILNMSNVLIFISGMDRHVYSSIAIELENVVANDDITVAYREDKRSRYFQIETMHSYQSLQIMCLQEQDHNELSENIVPLEDIVLHEQCLLENDVQTLQKIVEVNKDGIKSLNIYGHEQWIENFFKNIDSAIFQSLEAVRFEKSFETTVVNHILTKSSRTLKSLVFSECSCLSNLLLTGDFRFRSDDLTLSHNDMQQLYCSLKNLPLLKSLSIGCIKCSDHGNDCGGASLELSSLNKLQQLYLKQMPISKLQLSSVGLRKCTIDKDPSSRLRFTLPHNNIQDVFDSLGRAKELEYIDLRWIVCSDAPKNCSGFTLDLRLQSNLQILSLRAIPVLLSVEDIELPSVDNSSRNTSNPKRKRYSYGMSGMSVLLSTEMTSLREVVLKKTDIPTDTAKELVHNISNCKTMETLMISHSNYPGNIAMSLSPIITRLTRLELKYITMEFSSFRELIKVGELITKRHTGTGSVHLTNIIIQMPNDRTVDAICCYCEPHMVTVQMHDGSITLSEWKEILGTFEQNQQPLKLELCMHCTWNLNQALELKELLINIIAKLPQPVTVEIPNLCFAESFTQEEWKRITKEISSSPAFTVKEYTETKTMLAFFGTHYIDFPRDCFRIMKQL